MKKQIVKVIKTELKMTQNEEYRKELEALLTLSKETGDSFESNMSFYQKAKNHLTDTSPREQIFLIKEEYCKSMGED